MREGWGGSLTANRVGFEMVVQWRVDGLRRTCVAARCCSRGGGVAWRVIFRVGVRESVHRGLKALIEGGWSELGVRDQIERSPQRGSGLISTSRPQHGERGSTYAAQSAGSGPASRVGMVGAPRRLGAAWPLLCCSRDGRFGSKHTDVNEKRRRAGQSLHGPPPRGVAG